MRRRDLWTRTVAPTFSSASMGSRSFCRQFLPGYTAPLSHHDFTWIRDEPKGHHKVKLMESQATQRAFMKWFGSGKEGRFYAEKENLATHLGRYWLGEEHVPATFLVKEEEKEETVWYLASKEIPKFVDLKTFGDDPFFVDNKGITRLRVHPQGSVVTHGRIKDKLVGWMMGECDPNPQNRAVSFVPSKKVIHGVEDSTPRYPIVIIDWEFALPSITQMEDMKVTEMLYEDHASYAENLAGEQGIQSVWPEFNKHNLPVLNRRPAKREILEKVDNTPIEDIEIIFRKCISTHRDPLFQKEWAVILGNFGGRLFAFKEAAMLMREEKKAVVANFEERKEQFTLDFTCQLLEIGRGIDI